MKPMLSRILKAVCAISVAAMLFACGSGKTVDPLVAKRVIGLGDAYNDVGYVGGLRYTVRPLVTPVAGTSVVEQLAALLGTGNAGTAVTARTSLPLLGVFSYAQGGTLVLSGANNNTLADQAIDAIADVGGRFNSNDVIVVTAGAGDLRAGKSPTELATAVTSAVTSLLNANAQYVVVMVPIDVSKMPGGQGSALAGATDSYGNSLALQIRKLNKANSRNPVVLSDPALSFNLLSATTSGFADNTFGVTPGSVPGYCGANETSGCDEVPGQLPAYTAMFFADKYNLTPAGNGWVANLLNSATRLAGWR